MTRAGRQRGGGRTALGGLVGPEASPWQPQSQCQTYVALAGPIRMLPTQPS